MSSNAPTFVGACLRGKAFVNDVDDWVDEWHDAEDDDRSLDEFLGFTPDEGKLWAEKPEVLGAIVAAHRSRLPVETVLRSQGSYALAARSVSLEDAEDVLKWLSDRGRIGSTSS